MDNNLKTPEDFIQKYYSQIKNSLNIDDININRMGFIGFFYEMLGNTQFDVKSYFDNLFIEAFPVTAVNNENLLYHSQVYGYVPEFAKPSSIQGTFKFDFSKLPVIPYEAVRREILVSDSSYPLNLNLTETFIDQTLSLNYTLESQYKLIFEKTVNSNIYRVTCEIKTDKEYEIISLISNTPFVKISNLRQYVTDVQEFKIPKYVFGVYYSVELDLIDNIYSMEVEVKEKNASDYKIYKTNPNKSFVNSTDEVVFYRISPNNKLILEFGSGINSKYIPYADVRVTLKLTKGEVGNISTNTIYPACTIRILDFDSNNVPITESTKTIPYNNNFIIANISGSYDGKDAELNTVLRNNLVKYIQSRNNLMSEVDFENNLKSYFDVCEILFKKIDIIENIIYCYIPIYDRYLNPVNTITTSVLKSDFERVKFENPITKDILIYEPNITIENKEFICPFLFIYNKLTRLYEGYFVVENSIVNYSEKESSLSSTTNLYIEVEFLVNKTRLWLRSYSDISNYEFRITSNTLFFDNNILTRFGDSFYIDYFNSIIIKDSSVEISLFNNDRLECKYRFNNVKSIYSFAQILKLKSIPINNIQYICNLPLIEKDTYFTEKKYYQEKILSFMQNLTISQNRMLSDEVQLRFLNSYYIDQKFVKNLILQYTVTPELEVKNYYLPFKLEINMDFAKDLILARSKNITDESDNIISKITEYLLATQTGLNISFYKTKIIDIIHNNDLIKNASVILKDAKGNLILNSNFENTNNAIFIEKLNKTDYLHYSPIYYWFDLNDIKVTLKAYD